MKIILSKNLQEQLTYFFEQHPPQTFSNSLRSVLLQYMQANVRAGFPLQFDQFLWAMDDLFLLLDTAAAEVAKQSVQKQQIDCA